MKKIKAYRGVCCDDKSYIYHKAKHGALGTSGIYFTTDYNRALSYATKNGEGYVVTAEIMLDSPLEVPTSYDIPAKFILSPTAYIIRENKQGNPYYLLESQDATRLKKKGFDGICWGDEILVYDKTKINIISTTKVHWK